MKLGMIVVWISLISYILFVFKKNIVSKKERKWVYVFVGAALGISMLDFFHLSLSTITTFLNVTFEGILRMVVKL
ncbi:hypothetical protein [Neobacillus cucumis]|uniref:hypothetical protein n=1 Tax=Neobacillus cucumis TaxID=1740721 RepID=UPI001966B7FB|nr:hypothetical protein [Neobacillus cucumis]MBM7655330.1 hypothetical protein [Neobacillus cucumis]MED4223815.1 hypothetical protein [Neobacillus cucumis]